MVPKIIGIAQEEMDNRTIGALLSTAPKDLSDGKLIGYVHIWNSE